MARRTTEQSTSSTDRAQVSAPPRRTGVTTRREVILAGRAISYTVSAQVTAKAAGSLAGLLRNYWSSPSVWVIQLISLAVIVGFSMIPWRKVLHISTPTATEQTQPAGSTSNV